MSEQIDNYVDEISKREELPRQPIIETTTPVQINDNKHKCVWKKEEKQTHPTLISYICTHPKCGRGRYIDESNDSIANY